MLSVWVAVLSAFVAASIGSIAPGKRSDFSMSDNQFYRVGDTKLDDEVTDCALVEHQFKKGYIRLREYLERRRGCGRQGKLKNIEGIEKSTVDDVNNDNIAEIAKSTTEDFHYSVPSPLPVAKKVHKPKTIPQVINTYQPHKMAYVPRRYPVAAVTATGKTIALHTPARPAFQSTVQRNKPARPNLSDYQSKSQNLGLSFKSNPSVAGFPGSVENQNTQSIFTNALGDQYTRLASNYNHPDQPKPNHDLLQTFYPGTLQERSHTGETVAVGQPLFVQKAHVQATSSLQNKMSSLLKNAMNNFNKPSLGTPASANTFKGPSINLKPKVLNKPATKINVQSNPDENIDENLAAMRDPEKDDSNGSIDDKPTPEPGIDDKPANQAAISPSTNLSELSLSQRPGENLRPMKPVSDTSNGLGKAVMKGTPTFVNKLQNAAAQPNTAAEKLQQPSINFDFLKNKIMHTTNATFLRRMLALIQKITHHKDFSKLQAPARSLVAQANTAVQALTSAYKERVSSSPLAGGNGDQLYPLSKKSAVQRFSQAYNGRISASPLNLGFVNQIYRNTYPVTKKATLPVMNQAYNPRIAALRPANRFYGNNFSALTKKFQIARNPYYQNYYQYGKPYYSNLQSMQYGLYNGNVP
ncbi:uncharacterized protein LOC111337373 [Stylophora pistillata]|uniref:Uncharacterized protein n=1 Tax=Stylophora pistillata TaxID=50429 RepID=A0A2B4SY47_STYPI|nr:uncharacterized protein LOC111337373 [Stylophora pistillata]PFX33492.1 hypothetical protein AWC38_SpisGene1619 [Stylophora pistillata]